MPVYGINRIEESNNNFYISRNCTIWGIFKLYVKQYSVHTSRIELDYIFEKL